MDNLYNRVSRQRQPGQKGFTLIELLVVIAILAILAAVVIFNIVGVTNRGKTSACATDVKTVLSAADAYYNDNNQTYPGSPLNLASGGPIVPKYLHTTSTNVGAVTIDANGTTSSSICGSP